MVRCIFRKRRLLKPPRIKSKTGCPEVDLLTEFHCSTYTEFAYFSCKVRAGPPIELLGHPINKLTLLKTVAVVLNFKFWLP